MSKSEVVMVVVVLVLLVLVGACVASLFEQGPGDVTTSECLASCDAQITPGSSLQEYLTCTAACR